MTRAVATKLSGILALAFCCVVHAELDDRLALIDDYVNAYVDMAAFDGVVLIAEGGNIVYRQNFGNADYSQSVPMSPETVFRIASLSKQVTQAAIGRLIDQGKLTTDQPLSDFLRDFPNAERMSIRQLLDHTAGVAHTNRLGWMDMKSAMTLDEIVEGLSGEALLFTPGENNQYSNGGYALLAKVIEVASEMTFGEFIASEFTHKGYPSIGHETANEVVAGMATRYAPGPVYGQRVNAETYITANRIGGGSLYANAADILRFFIDSYGGEILSAATTGEMFPRPEDGDIQITGRSPGALAQIYLGLNDGLTVGTFSSNSAWPGSLNSDVVALYRGEDATLTDFTVSHAPLGDTERSSVTGEFVADRFGWDWTIVPEGNQFAIRQNELHTAFVRTTDGEFHAPIYDWLCRYSDYGLEFECRQRDPDAEIRFNFQRR